MRMKFFQFFFFYAICIFGTNNKKNIKHNYFIQEKERRHETDKREIIKSFPKSKTPRKTVFTGQFSDRKVERRLKLTFSLIVTSSRLFLTFSLVVICRGILQLLSFSFRLSEIRQNLEDVSTTIQVLEGTESNCVANWQRPA